MKCRIELEVEVEEEVIAAEEDDAQYRGTPDEWSYMSDIEWAQGIGAITDDPSIVNWEEVTDGG